MKQQEICMLSLSWPQRLQVLNSDRRYLIFLYLIWGCSPWPSTKQDLSPDHDLQIVLMASLLCFETGQTEEQGRLELLVRLTDLGKNPFVWLLVCGFWGLYVSFFGNMDMCWIKIHWTPSPWSIPFIQAKAVLQHLAENNVHIFHKHWKMFLNGSVDSLLNFEEQ